MTEEALTLPAGGATTEYGLSQVLSIETTAVGSCLCMLAMP